MHCWVCLRIKEYSRGKRQALIAIIKYTSGNLMSNIPLDQMCNLIAYLHLDVNVRVS